MKISLLLCLAILLNSCGSGSSGGGRTTPSSESQGSISKVYLTASHLPTCVAGIEGQLAYLKDSGSFKACEKGVWSDISIKGEKGDTGAAGTAGATGASGNNGVGFTLKQSVLCQSDIVSQTDFASISMNAVPAGGLIFEYHILTFSNNTTMINAQVVAPDASYASSTIRDSTQVGYEKAASSVIGYDVSGADNYGFWAFSTDQTLSPYPGNPYLAIYNDGDLSGANKTRMIVFDVQNECETTNY